MRFESPQNLTAQSQFCTVERAAFVSAMLRQAHTLDIFVPLPSVWTALQTGNVIEQIRMASSLVTSHPVHFWLFLSKLEDYTYGWLRDHLLSFRTESLIFNTYLLSKVILLPVISGIFLQLNLL